MFELSLKIWHQWNWESSFITVHVRQVLWIKKGNQKLSARKKRTVSGSIVLSDMFPKTGEVSAYSTESLIVSFRLHLKGLQQFHLFCYTSKTPLSPTIRQSSLYQRGRASSLATIPIAQRPKYARWSLWNPIAAATEVRKFLGLWPVKCDSKPSGSKSVPELGAHSPATLRGTGKSLKSLPIKEANPEGETSRLLVELQSEEGSMTK